MTHSGDGTAPPVGPLPSARRGLELLVGLPVELRLLGAPGLVVAVALPVAGGRERLLPDAAVEDQVPPDLAHDLCLAVDEGMHLPLWELQVADGRDERVAG